MHRPEHAPTIEDLMTVLVAHPWLTQVHALYISTYLRGEIGVYTAPADFEAVCAQLDTQPVWDHRATISGATIRVGSILLGTEYSFSELPQSQRDAATAVRLQS